VKIKQQDRAKKRVFRRERNFEIKRGRYVLRERGEMVDRRGE